MAVIWLYRRHALTQGALGFHVVSDELAADCIAKGIAQPPTPPFAFRDYAWPKSLDLYAWPKSLDLMQAETAADRADDARNSAAAASDLNPPDAPRRRGRPPKGAS